MLIPLQPPEVWDIVNEQLRINLGYKNENQVRTYPNLYSAVEEITLQLASFLSHKRQFTWVKGMSPVFESPLSVLLREGFQIQGIDWKVCSQFAGQEVQWVNDLPANTLFVLAFEDHAVTGFKQDFTELEKALANKKIFFIRVSHFQLPSESDEISPFTVWIGPTGYSEQAAAVCGARFRAPERGMPYYPWKKLSEKSKRHVFSEDKNIVEKVEGEFSEARWFDGQQRRRYDRVVLCFQDLSGEAILNRLAIKLKMPIDSTVAQTTSLCAWNSVKLFKSWWTPAPSPEQLRGLVIFSYHIAQQDDFIPLLKQTLLELRAEANW